MTTGQEQQIACRARSIEYVRLQLRLRQCIGGFRLVLLPTESSAPAQPPATMRLANKPLTILAELINIQRHEQVERNLMSFEFGVHERLRASSSESLFFICT